MKRIDLDKEVEKFSKQLVKSKSHYNIYHLHMICLLK